MEFYANLRFLSLSMYPMAKSSSDEKKQKAVYTTTSSVSFKSYVKAYEKALLPLNRCLSKATFNVAYAEHAYLIGF